MLDSFDKRDVFIPMLMEIQSFELLLIIFEGRAKRIELSKVQDFFEKNTFGVLIKKIRGASAGSSSEGVS